ncbi:PqqD family protein [Halobacillus litoralis]|uniref:PqqD family protein n=1 Tax=Halobacillus litoralis TaxID=45668 RepID=UPI001CFE7FEB|nr:PqqD family protein [Halobacillus litoralis]WLR49154.1 PqqD family protein [Halobacillus litoralis]
MRPLLKRKKQHEIVEMDKEWMVLDLEAYTITTLNEVGSFCWSILHEDKSLEDIVNIVADEYQMEPRDVEHDVTLFIYKMEDVGLIEHVC